MQKFATVEEFRGDLDIEICAILERDFSISDIQISHPDGEAVTKEFMDSITSEENERIENAIQEAEVYTGY